MKKGIILTFCTAIISGVSIFINQFGVKVVNPYIFAGLKNIVVAVLLFGIIILIKKWPEIKKLSKKDWLNLIIIGLVGGSVPFLLFFKGLSMSNGPEAAYLHKFMFVFVLLLAPILLKEKLKWHSFIGFIFLILGSVLLYKINGVIKWNNGDSLIISATFLWALENMISKKVLNKLSGSIVGFGRMFFGSLFIIIFWATTNQLHSLLTLNVQQINWVLVSGALLFFYVLTWYNGLKQIPVSLAMAVLALGAPITSFLEIIQGKVYSTTQIFGIVCMFAGVIIYYILEKKCLPSKTLAATR